MAQDIYIKFKGDASDLLSTVNRVNQSLRGLQNNSQQASRSLQNIETRSSSLSASMRGLTGVVAGLAGAFGIRELAQFGDTVQNIQNRLALINPKLGTVSENFERIKNIANSTFQPLENVADLFQQVARSADQYNLSADQVGKVTTTFTNLLRLAGADAGTAAGAITQLSQALGSGVLRGDEFNSVMEATKGEILPLLARELGVSTTEVRKLAEEGKITGAVVARALGNSFDEVSARVNGMNATIGGALTVLQNKFLELGTKTTPVLNAIAQGILVLADNLQRIVSYAVAAGAVFVGYKVALAAAAIATGGLSAALMVLRGALLRTGIGAIVVLLGEAVFHTSEWVDRVGGLGAAWMQVKTYASNAWGWIKTYVGAVLEGIGNEFKLLGMRFELAGMVIKQLWQEVIAYMVQKWADFVQTFGSGINQLAEMLDMDPVFDIFGIQAYASMLDHAASNTDIRVNEMRDKIEAFRDTAWDSFSNASYAGMTFGQSLTIPEEGINALLPPVKKLSEGFDNVADAATNTKKELSELDRALKNFVVTADQAAAASVTAAARALESYADPLDAAQKDFEETLTGFEILRDRDLISEEQYLSAKARLNQEYAKQIAEIQRKSAVESLRSAGVTNQGIMTVYEQTFASMQQAQQGGLTGMIGFTDAMSTVFNELGKQNKRAFEAAKAFNIASAIMNTALAATKAFAQGGVLGFVTAAAVIAAGMAQVAAIRSQTYSGRALGGPVMGGETYLVGENGPELFTPATSGRVTRNDQMGGGQPVEITFNINAIDSQGIDQVLVARQSVIRQLISDAMLEAGQRSRF